MVIDMDLISTYQTINNATLAVLRSTNKLTITSEEKKEVPARLVDSPLVITEEIISSRAAITAHDLQQYRVEFYSITLKDSVDSWLLDLLFDEEEQRYVT